LFEIFILELAGEAGNSDQQIVGGGIPELRVPTSDGIHNRPFNFGLCNSIWVATNRRVKRRKHEHGKHCTDRHEPKDRIRTGNA